MKNQRASSKNVCSTIFLKSFSSSFFHFESSLKISVEAILWAPSTGNVAMSSSSGVEIFNLIHDHSSSCLFILFHVHFGHCHILSLEFCPLRPAQVGEMGIPRWKALLDSSDTETVRGHSVQFHCALQLYMVNLVSLFHFLR